MTFNVATDDEECHRRSNTDVYSLTIMARTVSFICRQTSKNDINARILGASDRPLLHKKIQQEYITKRYNRIM